jgi:hypothetical protein
MSAHKKDSPRESVRGDSNDLKAPYKVDADLEQEAHLDTAIGTAAVTDHHAERALCRKFDYRLMPVLALMYLFNALDKGNLGNAKTDGMDKDLNFKGDQYNIILSIFYIPYVLTAPPLVSTHYHVE